LISLEIAKYPAAIIVSQQVFLKVKILLNKEIPKFSVSLSMQILNVGLDWKYLVWIDNGQSAWPKSFYNQIFTCSWIKHNVG